MRLINSIVDTLRLLFGTDDKSPELDSAEIFEDERGVWKIRYGASVIGDFDSIERARRTAEDWNFLKVQNHESQT